MKTIYTIHLNHDGLWFEAYSNKKALWSAIETSLESYENCRTIEICVQKKGEYKMVDLPFNYANLVRAFKNQDEFSITDGSYGGDKISIKTLYLKSK
jgi:hypothetical protein